MSRRRLARGWLRVVGAVALGIGCAAAPAALLGEQSLDRTAASVAAVPAAVAHVGTTAVRGVAASAAATRPAVGGGTAGTLAPTAVVVVVAVLLAAVAVRRGGAAVSLTATAVVPRAPPRRSGIESHSS